MSTAWSVAVFTSREDAATLGRTVAAVLEAAGSTPTTIDILVDGNAASADSLAMSTPRVVAGIVLRVWLVGWRDKACTWNRYLHEIAPAADVAFFVDGCARPRPDGFALLANALAAHPAAGAATAVPTAGRSAAGQRRRLVEDGGLHGSLYALRRSAVAEFRRRGFRLPFGLYRNDSLIGAVLAFAFDPATAPWDPSRIVVVTGATWDQDVPPAWRLATIRGYWRRRARQTQGVLENAAIRAHLAIAKRAPEDLPRTVAALVAHGPPVASSGTVVDRWLATRAALRLAVPVDWSRCDEAPRLVRTWTSA